MRVHLHQRPSYELDRDEQLRASRAIQWLLDRGLHPVWSNAGPPRQVGPKILTWLNVICREPVEVVMTALQFAVVVDAETGKPVNLIRSGWGTGEPQRDERWREWIRWVGVRRPRSKFDEKYGEWRVHPWRDVRLTNYVAPSMWGHNTPHFELEGWPERLHEVAQEWRKAKGCFTDHNNEVVKEILPRVASLAADCLLQEAS